MAMGAFFLDCQPSALHSSPRFGILHPMTDKFLEKPPAGPDAWREAWQADSRPRPQSSALEPFFAFVRRLVRRVLEPDTSMQRDYNVVLLDLLAGLRTDIEALRRDARADVEALQRDMTTADVSLSTRVEESRDFVRIGASRGDALAAALDQKLETLAVRLRDLSTPLLAKAGPTTASDFLYRRLEDGLRGSESEIRAAVAPYVELAKTHQPVIDAGCGRGEFLVACVAARVEARGFDTNERSVADLRSRGFDVAVDRIPNCFTAIADGSVGSILAMHVVEHLPVDELFALFAQAARVLRSGGLLMLETPNAESLLVSGSEFWRDPTHLAPRHPAALTLLAREHGFIIDTIRTVHPFPEGTSLPISPDDDPALRRVVSAINERFFGFQDLVLIARKE